jgi:hypothetical protein
VTGHSVTNSIRGLSKRNLSDPLTRAFTMTALYAASSPRANRRTTSSARYRKRPILRTKVKENGVTDL